MTTPIALRPWQDDDARDLLEIFAASDDLATQYPVQVQSAADAAECLGTMLAWDENRRNFAITVDGVPVGNVGITHIEHRHSTAWVSYFSSGAVRGRGYVRRATIAATNWALCELGIFRLELGHRVNNPASGAIARAAGFVLEGRQRLKLRYGQERFDTDVYARLATDPMPDVRGVALAAVPIPARQEVP